ncbi:hypothetical protein P872_08240 [Rhodonellum psychrophilum GCM71 = DSM 17998]|uniref:Uncharacterized protein n=1 Tax=Rhodonellum psychrophilum GCM71 = DSM 17998 TaxID=1123057 RepID=U5BX56_9BACT|nr:hypothetical protein P872_08240 [Rhodonellum psychrophilum GCM71 = DSM 17998]
MSENRFSTRFLFCFKERVAFWEYFLEQHLADFGSVISAKVKISLREWSEKPEIFDGFR